MGTFHSRFPSPMALPTVVVVALVACLIGAVAAVETTTTISVESLKDDGATSCRPVVLIHGLLDELKDFDDLQDWINTACNGDVNITVVSDFVGITSLIGLWQQMPEFYHNVAPLLTGSEDTWVSLLCFSQGNIICRALLQTLDNHNVHTYVSMAGPHAGQFGITSFLHFLPFHNLTREEAYLLFYTPKSQEDISIANYWNDPFHQSLYLTENIWLPYFNALPGGPCNATESARFGANLNRLKQLVLIGGPQDGPCALCACVPVCVCSVCVSH